MTQRAENDFNYGKSSALCEKKTITMARKTTQL